MEKPSLEDLFASDSEIMGLTRSHFFSAQDVADGLQTPLGAIETWSFSLKSVFAILLDAYCPMFLVWDGATSQQNDGERILFYNRAYRDLKETQLLSSAGLAADQRIANCSHRQADIEQVLTTGQTVRREPAAFLVDQTGNCSGQRYTWSYSAVWDETGHVRGVCATGYQVMATETEAETPGEAQFQAVQRPHPVLQQPMAELLRQVEAALRESEDRFQAFMSYGPTSAWIADQDGQLLYLSPTYSKMFQFLQQDAVGKQIDDLYSQEFAQPFLENNHRVFQTGQVIETLETAPRPDGSIGFFLVYKFPIRAASEGICLGGVAVDITEHKHTEEILRQREAELRLITDALPALVAYVDKDHCYRFNNQTYETWFGQPAATFTGQHIRAVLGDAAYETVRPYMEQALSGQQVSFESQIEYREGGIRYIAADYVPHVNSQGEVEGYFSLISDISERKRVEDERKQVEAAFRKSEANFRAMFTVINVGMVQTDATDRRFLQVNNAFCRITGYTEAELLNLTVDDINHPEDRDRARERFNQLLQGEVDTYQLEKRYRHKDGSTVWVLAAGNIIRGANGEPLRAIAVVQDITERKQTEDYLRASEERFRLVTQAVNGLIFDWNLQTNAVYRSEKLYDLIGIHAEAAPPEATWWQERIHPDDLTRLQPQMVEWLASSAHVHDSEYRVRHEDGHWVDVWEQACLVRDEQGQPIRIVGCTVDISDRKQTEADLRQGEERLRLAMEGAQMGTWDVDLITGKAIWSDYHFLMLGYEPTSTGEASETLWYERIHPEDRERVSQAWQRSQQERRAYQAEYRVIRADNGQVAWLAALGSFTCNQNHEVVRSIGVLFDITDRKRAERALRRSEGQLRLAQQAAGAGLWDWDLTSNRVTWSEEYYQLYGLDPSTPASYQNWIASIFEPDRDYVDQVARDTLAYRANLNVEFRVLHPTKGLCWLTAIGQTFCNSDGQAIRMTGIALNITDRKQAEEALRTSAERLGVAMAAARLGDWSWNASTDGVTFSEHGAEIFGIPFNSPITWTQIRHLLHVEDREKAQVEVERAILEHQDYDIEYRVIHPDGTERWVAAKGRAQYDSSGQVLGMLGVVQDITHRKQSEVEREQLLAREKSAKETLQRFIEHTPVAVSMLDRDMRYLFASQQWMQEYASGYTDLKGLSHYEVITDTPEHWRQVHQRCLAGAVESCAEDYYPRADGSSLWLHWEVLPWYVGDEIGGIIIFAENITERKQAAQDREKLLEREQQSRRDAEQANRIKDEFLAVLSHELRSPLNPILGWAKLLQTRQFDQLSTIRALETIERNAKLQAQLIDDLLDVSRILRGKMMLNVCAIDLATVIDAAIETVRLSAEAKRIDIQTVRADNIGLIVGDSGRLQQVLWNLLSNAVKFTPTGGWIEIHLDQVGDNARIRVKDTGKGITPEFLPYVFEYFRQEDGTTTRKFGGLGLGLAIVRYLTELHGGTVKAESPGEGLGATFTVLLPISNHRNQGESVGQGNSHSETDRFALTDVRILVVDDELDMRELISAILEQTGAAIKVAASAAEGLEILEQFKPDILISDIGLPEMNGYELMHQLRSLSPEQGGQIPAIALTAYAGELDQQQALAVGFQRHLAKPIEPDTLVRAIAALINL